MTLDGGLLEHDADLNFVLKQKTLERLLAGTWDQINMLELLVDIRKNRNQSTLVRLLHAFEHMALTGVERMPHAARVASTIMGAAAVGAGALCAAAAAAAALNARSCCW